MTTRLEKFVAKLAKKSTRRAARALQRHQRIEKTLEPLVTAEVLVGIIVAVELARRTTATEEQSGAMTLAEDWATEMLTWMRQSGQ